MKITPFADRMSNWIADKNETSAQFNRDCATFSSDEARDDFIMKVAYAHNMEVMFQISDGIQVGLVLIEKEERIIDPSQIIRAMTLLFLEGSGNDILGRIDFHDTPQKAFNVLSMIMLQDNNLA